LPWEAFSDFPSASITSESIPQPVHRDHCIAPHMILEE